jgi:PmbA protein
VSELAALAEKTLRQARQTGAEDAEILLQETARFSVRVRHGTTETLTEAVSRALYLRVFLDGRMARASTSDLRDSVIAGLSARATERARLANQDPYAGLPDAHPKPATADELELYDSTLERQPTQEKIAMATEAECIGLQLDPRVRNSGGATYHTSRGRIFLANTKGFVGEYRASSCSVGLHLLGQDGPGNEQVSDYWYSAARHRSRLDSPEEIARVAVERVRRHFGARKVPTQEAPVVLEPVLAAELLSDLFGAITGEAVYLKRSFLADALDQQVASEEVTLVDDGLKPRGLGTRPFDGEGVATQRTVVMDKGALRNFLCGSYSARKLKRRPTGNGTGNGESPTNFYLLAGTHDPDTILRSVDNGLYLTRILGQGVNLVTGDYSRGAFGLWIEKGQLTYPVHEITISGNLRRMLEGIEMVGRDLDFRDQFAAPTIKISSMTIAGA